MANIVSSVLTVDTVVQKDGRVWVTETHTDLLGGVHVFAYWALSSDPNLNTRMAQRAINIGNDLANLEIANNFFLTETLGKNATPVTHFSTAAQNVSALAAAWPTLLNQQAIFIGDYLNTLPLATLESVFGWTPTQATQVSTDFLQPYATLAQSIRTAQGGIF